MSPTKLLIEVVFIALLAAPVLAEETAPAPPAETGTGSAQGSQPADEAQPADEPMDAAQMDADEPVPAALDPQVEAPMGGEAALAEGEDEPQPGVAVRESETEELLSEADAVPAALDDAVDATSAVESMEPAALDSPVMDPMSPEAGSTPGLGAIGYDSQGRRGRIHIVVPRDTLWDISNAYLGTPWVWPSIWQDNDDIANPHLIHPGDHIWITPSEMRRVTPEEAAMLLANQPLQGEPAAMDEEPMEPRPEVVPELVAQPVDRGSYRVSARETAGLVTPEQLEASASIVDSVPERVLMSQEDAVYIGLGEADVEPGDQLTIFRTNEKVFDPDTRALLGYHVEMLGWVEVMETYPETSLARIGMSTSEVEVSDRLMPREPLPPEIPIQAGPADVEGKISFFPSKRVLMGYNDFVYLNRGALDGLEVGSPLVVYRPGRMASETTRGEQVHVPDAVIARMLVVRAEDQSAVALVTHTSVELKLGDRFRGAN
jgi:hypothetical protein